MAEIVRSGFFGNIVLKEKKVENVNIIQINFPRTVSLFFSSKMYMYELTYLQDMVLHLQEEAISYVNISQKNVEIFSQTHDAVQEYYELLPQTSRFLALKTHLYTDAFLFQNKHMVRSAKKEVNTLDAVISHVKKGIPYCGHDIIMQEVRTFSQSLERIKNNCHRIVDYYDQIKSIKSQYSYRDLLL